MDTNPLQDALTLDLALYLLDFLDPKSLVRLGATCRFWNVLSNDPMVWKHKVVARFKLDGHATATRLHFEAPHEQTWQALFARLDSYNSSFKGFAIDRATNQFLPYPFELLTDNSPISNARKDLTNRLLHITESRRERELELERMAFQYDGQDHPLILEPTLETWPEHYSYWTSPVIDAIFSTDEPEELIAEPTVFLRDLVPAPTRSVRGMIRWPTLGDALSKIRGTIVEDHKPLRLRAERRNSVSLARQFLASSPLPSWMVNRAAKFGFHPIRYEIDSWTGCSGIISIEFEEYSLVRGQNIAIPNQYHAILAGPVLLGIFNPGHPMFLGTVVAVMEEALPRLKPKLLVNGEFRGYITHVHCNPTFAFRCSLTLDRVLPSDDCLGIVSGKMRVFVKLEVFDEVCTFEVVMSVLAKVSLIDDCGNVLVDEVNQGVNDHRVILHSVLSLEDGTDARVMSWVQAHLPIRGQLCILIRKGDFLLGYYHEPQVSAFYFQL